MTNAKSNKSKNITSDFELWKLLDHARSAISRPREVELAQIGLTPEQAAVLHTLQFLGGSASYDDIADNTMRQYNSVATLVNRMTRLGTLQKIKKAPDKKNKVIMTEKGIDIYKKIPMRSIEMAFSVLSTKQKEDLAFILEQLISKGRDMMGLNYKLPFLPD